MRYLLLALFFSAATLAEELPEPYEAFKTRDRFGREIHYYLTRNEGGGPKPIVVWIQGSGAYSHFLKRGDRVVETVRSLRLKLQGSARLLLVEKPGVHYLEETKPLGTAVAARAEFRREHTLERWTEALSASLADVQKRTDIDRARLLIAGHSEGALLACELAARYPDVTHVAPLSAGGVTQLYSLIELARRQSPERVDEVMRFWRDVQGDPNNPDKNWSGHPYPRWSSFLKSSCIQQLSKNSRAKVYMAHGTEDQASAMQGSEVLYAQLLAEGRSVVFERIEGADHGLQFKEQSDRNGLSEVFERIVKWFEK